jgi:hypothetical protein
MATKPKLFPAKVLKPTSRESRQLVDGINAAIEQLEEAKARLAKPVGAHPLDVARYLEWANGYVARATRDIVTALTSDGVRNG